jgi:hypothetical protein
MSAHVCCTLSGGENSLERTKKGGGTKVKVVRAGKLGSWLGPSAVLVLLPKCPACFAGYLALAGIGVSVEAASGFRIGLMAACITAISLVLVRSLIAAIR